MGFAFEVLPQINYGECIQREHAALPLDAYDCSELAATSDFEIWEAAQYSRREKQNA